MGAPERVAVFDELADGMLRSVTLSDGTTVCLARLGEQVTAVRDQCSHADFPLSQGYLNPDGTIECGWHGAQFRCADGAVCRGPATDPVECFDVLVDAGVVYVRRLIA
ncbi:MAG: Rieske 2Fe-2S domain-containing protein [Gemmatimonadaceae bacterium]|nr:Rieske 2Fe-2S domain-containing protein [Gemmatimonadaceae bacterium]